ncbi:hypothetical protein L2E82_27382 [Cichorium intybus]|uniref:Uncharacterized protein n=1 Tax=Cichorium intybus TaxID=13427 RepID=A0ACB9CT15_CICIN|nr:hypothetical protein L2E82_27382 [Cichorium intybus]
MPLIPHLPRRTPISAFSGYDSNKDAILQPNNLDSGDDNYAETSSISMTATMDTLGNLVLGNGSVKK